MISRLAAIKARLLSTRTAAQKRQASYETLVGACWEALWRYAYASTGNRDDAEDLLSETLLEGFKSFPQFRGEVPFVHWMRRVMTTTRIDMARRAAKRKTESLDALSRCGDSECATYEIADEGADLENVVISPMLSERVQQALLTLPEEFRAAVILADIERMEYAEASRLLQIPIGTLRSRLHRGRTLLRGLLSEQAETRE